MRILLVLLLCSMGRGSASTTIVSSDEQFEKTIIMSPNVWAVLFISKTREADEAKKVMVQVEAVVPGLSMAEADVDDVKAFASEFNVRKRMVPRLLLYVSRARQASIIKLGEGPLDANEVLQAVKEAVADNSERDADGKLLKLTLAIGATGSDEL